jgi:phytoene/squalene synthetase
LKPLVDDAADRLVAGDALIKQVDRGLRLPIRVFTAGGRAILAAIRQSGYDVWSRRPTVGRFAKLRILASALQSIWWPG